MFLALNGLQTDAARDRKVLGRDVKQLIVDHPEPADLRDRVGGLRVW